LTLMELDLLNKVAIPSPTNDTGDIGRTKKQLNQAIVLLARDPTSTGSTEKVLITTRP